MSFVSERQEQATNQEMKVNIVQKVPVEQVWSATEVEPAFEYRSAIGRQKQTTLWHDIIETPFAEAFEEVSVGVEHSNKRGASRQKERQGQRRKTRENSDVSKASHERF